MTKTEYSKKAMPQVAHPYKEYPEGGDHFKERVRFDLPGYMRANMNYNLRWLPNKRIEQLPKYKRALALGTGPSLDELTDDDVRNFDGAVILSQPLVRHFADILLQDNVYVADAEFEWFIIPYCYGEHTVKMQIVTPIQHHLEVTHPFRRIYYYDCTDTEAKWPRTTGALALKIGLDCMGAETTYAGIDLTGFFTRFEDETLPLRDRAKRWGE